VLVHWASHNIIRRSISFRQYSKLALSAKGDIVVDILQCLEDNIPNLPCLGFGDKLIFEMFVVEK